MENTIDYKILLVKYMDLVSTNEGIFYLSDPYIRRGPKFTEEEIKTLEDLQREIVAKDLLTPDGCVCSKLGCDNSPCKGQCGCLKCHDDYSDFLSGE